jgi:hypothetical protein
MLARCGAPAVRRVLHAAGCLGGVGASLRCPSPAPPPPRAASAAASAAVCSASARRALSLCVAAAAARGGSVDDIFGEADREELDLSDDRPLSRTASKKRCASPRGGCFSFMLVRCATSPLRHHALRRVPLARTSTQRTTSAAWAASWSHCRPRRSTGCRCHPTYAKQSTRHALSRTRCDVACHATRPCARADVCGCVCWRAQHLRIGGKRGTGANKKGKARVEALMAQCAPPLWPPPRCACMHATAV